MRRLSVVRYGADHWRAQLAAEMMVDKVTVWRWEKNGPPASVLVALRCLTK